MYSDYDFMRHRSTLTYLLTYLLIYLLTTVIGVTSSEAFKPTTYYCTPGTNSAWI